MSEPHRDETERIGAAIRATADRVEAPPDLRERIAAGRPRRAPVRPWGLASVGAVVAIAVLAVVIAWPSASRAEPSVADAARVALGASTLPPPAVDQDDRHFVVASVGGVRFPNYAYDSSWRAVGARRDALRGRSSATVAYAVGAVRVGYTIVDGRPLESPGGAGHAVAGVTPVRVARDDGTLTVWWERGGHTCVLASRTATLPQLLSFVSSRDEA